MIQTIISGIGLGLGLAIMLGPAFFALLQTSIDKGFRNAVRFAVGIFLSDMFLIAVAFLGVASLLGRPMVKEIVGLVGGGILIGIGIHTVLHRYKGRDIKKIETEIKEAAEIEKSILLYQLPRSVILYVKGFLLNLANPATWFFWIFWVGVVSTQYTNVKGQLNIFLLTIFFMCTLITVLGTDVLKAYVAHQLKNKINDNIMTKINVMFGLVVIVFGAILTLRSVYPIIEMMLKHSQ
ncbi:MAG: LysE family transporter [Bacteroidales bacterium]|jgi:threonine/homoserine/homoserine lactone efflux protein|nr:LysE family transporter [Bacteroidales bacterium]